jgi:hypothetical protein
MARPTIKVELAFNDKAPGDFFVLGDAVKGVLGNTTYVLQPGSIFYDVTEYIYNISTTRGKNRVLDRYQAGNISITFNNNNRYFDPAYESSPFFGQIVPRRDIRISANGKLIFYGTVDDWNLDYQINGLNTATVSAYDGFAFLAGQTLTAGTYSAQLSGSRVSAILADAGVRWPFGSTLDTGVETLQSDTVTASDNALQYLQVIESTEPGDLFVASDGKLVFYDRAHTFPSASVVVFADDDSGIEYTKIRVVYGSELLYTQTELTRKNSSTVARADALDSQALYGIRTLSQSDLLTNSDTALGNLAAYLVGQYSEPEYRFEQIEIVLSEQTLANQTVLLNLDLGSVCKVVFTPNGIGSPIERYVKIISVNHTINSVTHYLNIGFATLNNTNFILDDVAFGNLDLNILGY